MGGPARAPGVAGLQEAPGSLRVLLLVLHSHFKLGIIQDCRFAKLCETIFWYPFDNTDLCQHMPKKNPLRLVAGGTGDPSETLELDWPHSPQTS